MTHHTVIHQLNEPCCAFLMSPRHLDDRQRTGLQINSAPGYTNSAPRRASYSVKINVTLWSNFRPIPADIVPLRHGVAWGYARSPCKACSMRTTFKGVVCVTDGSEGTHCRQDISLFGFTINFPRSKTLYARFWPARLLIRGNLMNLCALCWSENS